MSLALPPSPDRCPICLKSNACGRNEVPSACWCATASVSPAMLEVLPEPLRGTACLCARCAAGDPPSPCNHICRLDDGAVCIGCDRTREEIMHWRTMDGPARARVLLRLQSIPRTDR